MTVIPTPGAAEVIGDVLISTSPATGAEVGRFPVADAEAVAATVVRARAASIWWRRLGYAERKRRLDAWRVLIVDRIDELTELMHREGGKPIDDALLEALVAVDHMHWAAKNARKVLGPKRVSSGVLMANQVSIAGYQPLGVVGVIGPWNYPVLTPLGSIVYALAAGNAVVFKPSEYTPAVGRWMADTFAEAVGDEPVFQVVTGLGETGAALCLSGVDKIAFTGSPGTARRVMATCARTLTPVVIEGGGKDVMIVDADANLDAAASAALWGGMSNAGQTCIGVERIYVVAPVFDRFVDLLAAKARELRVGDEPDADYGAITMPGQIEVIARHIDDALKRGAHAVVGGLESVRPPFVDPVILIDVPEDSAAIREETFGPVLTVSKVDTIDEAIEKTNAGRYGLGGAVFSRRDGMDIADRLRSGMVSINSVMSFVAVPALPFGGVGDSGFGRIHGADGLREFSRAKSITRQRFRLPMPIMSFDRTERTNTLLRKAATWLYGRH